MIKQQSRLWKCGTKIILQCLLFLGHLELVTSRDEARLNVYIYPAKILIRPSIYPSLEFVCLGFNGVKITSKTSCESGSNRCSIGSAMAYTALSLGNVTNDVKKEIIFGPSIVNVPPSATRIVYECTIWGLNGNTKTAGGMAIVTSDATIPIPPDCPAGEDHFGSHWPRSQRGIFVFDECPAKNGDKNYIFRFCNSKGVWQRSDYTRCRRKELEFEYQLLEGNGFELTETMIKAISANILSSLKSWKPAHAVDLHIFIELMGEISRRIKADKSLIVNYWILQNFSKITDILLSVDVLIWNKIKKYETAVIPIVAQHGDEGNIIERNVSGTPAISLLVAMDDIAKSSLRDPKIRHDVIIGERISIVRKLVTHRGDIYFPEFREKKIFEDVKDRGVPVKSTLYLKDKAIRSKTDVRYTILYYDNFDKVSLRGELRMNLFKIDSPVLSFSTNMENVDIASELHLQFLPFPRPNHKPLCVYLNTVNETELTWTNKSCRTKMDKDQRVNCYCRHFSNFGILMQPVKGQAEDEILNVISILGCVLSSICLVITLITYAALWSHVHGIRSSLHVCLCICLLMVYVLFLVAIERTGDPIECLVITVLLHYLLLLCFFIMLTEGIELYITAKGVLLHTTTSWMLLFPAFLTPLLIVSVTVGITWNERYRSPNFCWLNMESGVFWSFFGPMIFVIVTNIIIAILVIKRMMSTHFMETQEKRKKIKTMVKAICVLTPLLGFTWIFGLLHAGTYSPVVTYLFAISNSLHGLFIFIFHCVMVKKIRIALMNKYHHLKDRLM